MAQVRAEQTKHAIKSAPSDHNQHNLGSQGNGDNCAPGRVPLAGAAGADGGTSQKNVFERESGLFLISCGGSEVGGERGLFRKTSTSETVADYQGEPGW